MADNVGTALVNVHVMVEARPTSEKAWGARPSPLLGEGATDGEGDIQVALAPPNLADPIIVQNQFYNIQVSLVVPGGPPIPLLSLPRHLGTDPNLVEETADVGAKYKQVRVSAQAACQIRGG